MLRTPESHDTYACEVQKDGKLQSLNGMKRECVLSKHLKQSVFLPDILHNLCEGVVPVELSLYLQKLISNKYFTLDSLNAIIQSFPYKCLDRINRPQKITKTFSSKGTIGGNGHENWTLLRLLPFMIGTDVPENEKTLMDLKDIVERVAPSKFTEETVSYLETNISDHRQLLAEVFPDLRLRPKHHFIEHYPHLICCFGPLVDVWTMRFEAQHSFFCFFLKTVHDTQNFKNILMTLVTKHQLMVSYNLDSPSFFKPPLQVGKVSTIKICSLEKSMKLAVEQKYRYHSTVSLASSACLHGTSYAEGMIVSLLKF